MKIIMRYVLSAGGIAVLLLLTNFIVLVAWITSSMQYANTKYKVSEISQGLIKENHNFVLSDEASFAIDHKYKWAMLLDDDGKVVWSKNLPKSIPLSYTSSDIASFSKWYLNDYPVHVWKHPNGLFVLANNKNSAWKLQLEVPQKNMEDSAKWLFASLIINFAVAILLTFLFGIRFFLSLRIVIKGIDNLAKKKPIFINPKGVFKDLAYNINGTSKELLRQEKLIEKRDTARNNWITCVSHDIRTPLSMIMGYSSSLEDNEKFSEEERKQFSIIRSQSEKIKQLINDLNLTVKLEYDMEPLHIEPFYISELIRKVVADYLNNLSDEKYTLQLSISNETQNYMIDGDMRLFERALCNIIGNSIKHNEEGCDIYIKLEKKDDGCLIEIKDNGIGFKDDILENLNFSNEIPNDTSHGLGLFIVKQIMKVHHWKIHFKNWENGSSIVLKIK
ncbi:HAMP domain-containing sensor histidine kinase [Inediibacterium massiliense]|uniref:HAMP domain-containing sensor histidine kinase n=1 Tax=Inediibacterium massiliense TaxID=1658111 RepID=UPI001FA79D4D|nr:HAMP domain-containing sensor histidine kinase [Inediibacterium massiliense]